MEAVQRPKPFTNADMIIFLNDLARELNRSELTADEKAHLKDTYPTMHGFIENGVSLGFSWAAQRILNRIDRIPVNVEMFEGGRRG